MTQGHDIEDVLSSVRHLVAVEAGMSRTEARSGGRGRGSPLVLGEAHRVVEPEDAKSGTEDVSTEADDRTGPLVLARRADVETATPDERPPEDVPRSQVAADVAATAEPAPVTSLTTPSETAPLLLQPSQTVRAVTPAPDTPGEAPFRDEAALRALISEVVRQELAGDLGERMTRNVRRLVRREIQQALASDRFG